MNSASLAIKNAAYPERALHLYTQMQRKAHIFDSFSILFTLKSCTKLRNPTVIRHLHTHILKWGFSSHVYVATALLNAYVSSSFTDACQLFDELTMRNSVTWNTMITGYFRIGDVEKARGVFETMPLRNHASWSAMIAGYMNSGSWGKGLMLFHKMVAKERLMPDQYTLCSSLMACSYMGSIGLLLGKSLNGFAFKNGWTLNVELGTVLVDMYAKCGHLKNAYLIFDMMQDRNVISWTALICGAAQHGYGNEAISIFNEMIRTGVKPNELTFTGILSACAQAGLVENGRNYFRMISESGLAPRMHHYGCMVDLFGKAGKLKEAYEIIETMPFEPNVLVWSSFLSSCKLHRQFEMAERVVDRILGSVRPENHGGVYTLICDLYNLNDKCSEAERVRKLMVEQNVQKPRGSSFIFSGRSQMDPV